MRASHGGLPLAAAGSALPGSARRVSGYSQSAGEPCTIALFIYSGRSGCMIAGSMVALVTPMMRRAVWTGTA